LADIWKEVLQRDQFGVYDNFLELGGNSLQAIQILSRVRNGFQLDLSLPALFEAPTISETAELIEERLVEEINKMSEEEAQRLLDETTATA
jgi:aryl carrier-like protein